MVQPTMISRLQPWQKLNQQPNTQDDGHQHISLVHVSFASGQILAMFRNKDEYKSTVLTPSERSITGMRN